MKRTHLLAGLVVAGSFALSGPVAADAVTDWEVIAEGVAFPGRAGPIVLVDLGLVQAAVHDAVQSIEGRFEPYFISVPGARGSKVAAVAAAAHGVLKGFYPTQGPTLDTTLANYLAGKGLTGDPGVAVGETVAAAYLPLRRLDPVPPTVFVGGTLPGEWRPTEPAFSPMFAPWAATFHPLTLTGPGRFRAPPPPALTSAQYTRDFNEVKALGSLEGSTRTPAQQNLALFWTDNPIAMWQRALREISAKQGLTIGNNARLFALVTLSMADSFLMSWDSKLHYNFWRPITAIQLAEQDGNPDTAAQPDWEPLLTTPPYPDYTSGMNNLAGAWTQSLTRFFHTNNMAFKLTSNSPVAVQTTRNYTQFSDAAADCVLVRILHGIHFRFADTAARTQGRAVANYVHDHYLLPTGN